MREVIELKRLKLYQILKVVYENKQLDKGGEESDSDSDVASMDSDLCDQVLSNLKLEENMVDKFEEFTEFCLDNGIGGGWKGVFDSVVPRNIDIDGVDKCVDYFK